MSGVAGRTVLLAGATSASGHAAARALVAAGARVISVGRDAAKLEPLTALGAVAAECDLTDETAVGTLAAALHANGDRIDGILHLVGGWRGGGGLLGQSDEDYRALEGGLTALRHVTRAFWEDLLASPAARVAVVSSTAVARPLAGGANYAAIKAAEEAWARAMAQGFAKTARDAVAATARNAPDRGETARDGAGGAVAEPLQAASVIFRVKALAGLEDALAARFAALWDADAGGLNDRVLDLAAP